MSGCLAAMATEGPDAALAARDFFHVVSNLVVHVTGCGNDDIDGAVGTLECIEVAG